MAWNGRNVSILGAKDEAGKDASSSDDGGDASKTTTQAKDAAGANTVAPAPAPPLPSVWNGRHKKIIAVSETEPSGAAPAAAQLGVASPHPKVDTKSVVQQLQAKEDEATSSTAGSSITNTTIGEDSTLEVKVVTTKVTTAGSSDSEKKDRSHKDVPAGTTPKDASTVTVGTSYGHNHAERQHSHANSTSGVANATSGNTRRVRHGHNQSGNASNNGRYTPSRGNGRSDRRRGPNNGSQPSCHFFDQGSCNRGKECPYKHDLATGDAAPARRSGPYHEAKHGTNVKASTFVPSRRAFDPHKARAIVLAKEAQDNEDRSAFVSASHSPIIRGDRTAEGGLAAAAATKDEDPTFFSIDVECIATGYGSCAKGINDGCGNAGRQTEGVPVNQYNERSHRYPGRVAMVDSEGHVLADIIVRPPCDGEGVTSYLTPLTGLTADLCLGADAKSLDEAVATIKGLLPGNGVLVGQSIDHDVEWLGLVPGRDFSRMVDISEIFRQRLPNMLGQAAAALKKKEAQGSVPGGGDLATDGSGAPDPSSDAHLGFATRYRHFSLRHVCIHLLDEDIQAGVHDPVLDARYSLTLFHKYRYSSVTRLRIVRDGLHRAPATLGFAAENSPVLDSVCVSKAAYPHRRAARRIWQWYQAQKTQES